MRTPTNQLRTEKATATGPGRLAPILALLGACVLRTQFEPEKREEEFKKYHFAF